MKKRIFFVLLLVIAAAVLGAINRGARIFGRNSGGEVRSEIRQSYHLDPGARVEVSSINGTVEVQTAETNTAEVYVLSTATSQDDLDNRPVTIEQSSSSLVIRAQQQHSWAFWRMFHSGEAKQQVVLKVPRKIALNVKGVNGRVTAGQVDGSVEVHGVNGKVDVAQASDYSNISGVNGPVSIAVNQLGQDGMRISGVNGAIELSLSDSVNADLTANGINGKLRSDIPNVAVNNDESMHSKFSARIGTGGAPIRISGINGSIHLSRAANPAS